MEKLTFEQACDIVGQDPSIRPDFTGLPEVDAKRHTASFELDVIYRATNKQEDFIADFSNPTQLKYTAFMDYDYSLGSFVLGGTGYADTFTNLGARFWFGSTNTAREFFNHYVELINDAHRY